MLMADLIDQSALTVLTERLVEAARRAGADSADAVAVRGVSIAIEVREGAMENPNAPRATISACVCSLAGVRRWCRPTMCEPT